MIKIFIGFDHKEIVAYNVLQHSINVRATSPISITPININHIKNIFTREKNNLQSTEFSFSRFLVPYLCNYEGWAIFMDCDMMVIDDIKNLWDLRDDKYAVMCVKHEHKPKEDIKFLNQVQTQYEKKNWSSVMLLNCAKCKSLTLDYVNNASGLELHRFKWLQSEELIGEISQKWNHLVDYNDKREISEISNLHWTEGGPYFKNYKNCGYNEIWLNEFKNSTKIDL